MYFVAPETDHQLSVILFSVTLLGVQFFRVVVVVTASLLIRDILFTAESAANVMPVTVIPMSHTRLIATFFIEVRNTKSNGLS